MATYQIKKSWWADIRFNHRRIRKRSPENSRVGAEAYEAWLRHKLALGENVDKPIGVKQTFAQFAPKWLEEYVMPNNKLSEQRTKKYVLLNQLVPFFGKLYIEEITAHHIEKYKAKCIAEGYKRKSVNNHLAVFSKYLAIAYEWLKLPGSPPKIVWLKCPPPRTDFLSPDECALVLYHAEGVIREMVLTALRTGMRHGELTGLQWSSIDWENRILTVRHSRCPRTGVLNSPKSNKERHIPMDVDVYEMLFKRKKSTGYVFLNKGKPYGAEALIRHLRQVRYKVGLRPFTWHTFRHTFASHLAKNNPLHVVQILLGHSAISTTMRYAHVSQPMLRNAIDSLNPKEAFRADFGQPVVNEDFATQEVNSKKH
jgi:integrase